MVTGRPLETIGNIVAGKSVALVGNAASLFKRSHPIDDHDVVVRINGGPFVEDEEKRAGQRTDILLVSDFSDEKHLSAAPHVVWMTPKHRETLPSETRARLYFYPQQWWDLLFSQIGARPSTGCMGIDILTRLIGDGELHLYGFDFWKSPTSYTNEIRPGPHAPSAEEAYARAHPSPPHLLSEGVRRSGKLASPRLAGDPADHWNFTRSRSVTTSITSTIRKIARMIADAFLYWKRSNATFSS